MGCAWATQNVSLNSMNFSWFFTSFHASYNIILVRHFTSTIVEGKDFYMATACGCKSLTHFVDSFSFSTPCHYCCYYFLNSLWQDDKQWSCVCASIKAHFNNNDNFSSPQMKWIFFSFSHLSLIILQKELLGESLLEVVFNRLNLLETSYFGLRYVDLEGQTVSNDTIPWYRML